MSPAPVSFDRWLHDVRNQLSIILGFSEILLQEAGADDSRRMDLKEIHTAAERAMAAIQNPPRTEREGP